MTIPSGSHVKYRLGLGSPLLRASVWQAMPFRELKALIQRFSTKENQCFRKGRAGALWRRRRLAAVAVFEQRYGQAPLLFKQQKLPRLASYYVRKGQYLWPVPAQPDVQAGPVVPSV